MKRGSMIGTTSVSPSEPVDLCDGRLWLLGGVAPVTSRISWLRAEASGWESLNCYVLLEEDHALVLDTGVSVHCADILAQLDAVVGPEKPVSIYLTRLELDTICNLGPIADHVNLQGLFSAGFNADPFDFFDGVTTQTELTSDTGVKLGRRQDGETVDIGEQRRLEVIRPMLRLLATSWAFDAATGTLFTSDSFGHVQTQDPQVRAGAGDDLTERDVTAHLLTRFEWLRNTQAPEVLIDDLERTFGEREVTRIAPAHGCVITGEENVRRHLDWVLAALRDPSAFANEPGEIHAP